MKVHQLMSRDVKSCRPDESLAAAARLMWDFDCGAIPVVDDERRVLGVITDRDICMAAMHSGRPLHEMRIAESMSQTVIHTRAWDGVDEALALMARARVRRLPVIEAQGKLAGVISLTDLAKAAERERGLFPPLRLKDIGRVLATISHRPRPAAEMLPPATAYAEE